MASIHSTIPDDLKERLDDHVESDPVYQNRSEFIRRAIHEKLAREQDD